MYLGSLVDVGKPGEAEDSGLAPSGDRLRVSWRWGAVAVGLAVLLYAGWRAFWFLTDDAYITFRYISNHLAARGYVWNLPPFRPVEGYTSFLWMVLLERIWRVFGIPPPQSANTVSLVFAYGTLAVLIVTGLRMNLTGGGRRDRLVLVTLALLGTLTNRTFLAWTSSGLETAMLNFFITLWLFLTLFPGRRPGWWTFSITLAASLVYLTRPDGMLFVLGTAAVLAMGLARGQVKLRHLLYALPGLLVPAHLIWRKSYYGQWLPNTYYAKLVGVWPESGIRYGLCFAMEYSLWIWGSLFAIWLWKASRRRRATKTDRAADPVSSSPTLLIALGVLLAHAAYYTLVVGGDHFEYRVYSHLVPLMFVSAVWLADRVFSRRWAVCGSVALAVVLSWPVPWLHWGATHNLQTRAETRRLIHPVAPSFSQPFRAYVGLFDRMQRWLIVHSVCRRHQEHKVFHLHQCEVYPARGRGAEIPWEGRPVYAVRTVGVPGWVMPNVAIIDLFGLNDYVIARNRVTGEGGDRVMAHDRSPPPGYVECFDPNVELGRPGTVAVRERARPLEDRDIVRCEEGWWAWAER